MESGGLNLFAFVSNNPINFIDGLGLWSSWLWTDHQEMIDEAFKVITDIECLQDLDIRAAVVDNLKWANVGMDFSPKYNQSTYEQLPYHYNRGVFQDPKKAIREYLSFVARQKMIIDAALEEDIEDGCAIALKELGKLSHSIQDYYGHGVSENYGKRIPGRRRGKHGSVPRYGVGSMSGSPSNPTMQPSSYYLGGLFGNHGFILFPEPGTRAPDTDARKRASIDATIKLFRPYLEKWCRRCGKCQNKKVITIKKGNRNLPKGEDYDEFF